MWLLWSLWHHLISYLLQAIITPIASSAKANSSYYTCLQMFRCKPAFVCSRSSEPLLGRLVGCIKWAGNVESLEQFQSRNGTLGKTLFIIFMTEGGLLVLLVAAISLFFYFVAVRVVVVVAVDDVVVDDVVIVVVIFIGRHSKKTNPWKHFCWGKLADKHPATKRLGFLETLDKWSSSSG